MFSENTKGHRIWVNGLYDISMYMGKSRMTVYDTGRDLLNIGVIPLSDMITETAIVKAMWVIANSKDMESAKKMMQENIANEISAISPIEDR